jgi:dTDP-4-amino-4,6-dideoxygalactose transaminase
MFEFFGGGEYHLEITDWLCERVISLPIHTELDDEQQTLVINKVLEFINK